MRRDLVRIFVVFIALVGWGLDAGARRSSPVTRANDAGPTVTMTDLGVLAGATFGAAIDINNDGLVVGYSGAFENYCCGFIPPQPHAFLWNPATGQMHDVGVSMRAFGGGISSHGYAISDAGLIAGYTREAYFENSHPLFTSEASSVIAGPPWQPFVSSTWTMTIQASLGFISVPQDVNVSRVVVGTSTSSPQQAFVWDETAGIRALAIIAPGDSAANGINDAGVIVGWGSVAGVSHPLRWSATTGAVEDLGLPDGWLRAFAEDVNAFGTVTGYGVNASGDTRAFVWSDAAGFRVLGTLGGRDAFAQGINASGKVVGFSQTGSATHAFAWDPATDVMLDLGVLPGDGSSYAYAINDSDQIVGRSLGTIERPVLWTVTFVEPDTEAPTVACQTPDSVWHANDVVLGCTATDDGSGLADAADAGFSLTTHVPAGAVDSNASTDSRTVCDNVGNCATAGSIGGNKIDKKAPVVSCGAADGSWHGTDVGIACTASDNGAGLQAEPAFSLTTYVAAGVENANAPTDSRAVCDNAGNCTEAGPIGGNKIDKKAPTLAIAAPGAATYTLNQPIASNYACSDAGSGMALCAGPVVSGANISTSTVGIQTFTVTATDAAGNTASTGVMYTVGYNVCALFDQSKAYKSGSTIPIKLNLCDAAGVNVSNASVALAATAVYLISNSAPGPLADSGNANPDYQFRFVGGSYMFNLSLKGFTEGTYALAFTAGGGPTQYTVQIQIK